MRLASACVLVLVFSPVPAVTQTAPPRISAGTPESVQLTVYQQDFGVVREVRSAGIPRGRSILEAVGVAALLEPSTVQLRTDGGLSVREQTFHYDLLSQDRLLHRYVGRTVSIYVRGAGGAEERREATVLAVHDGVVVLEMDGELLTQVPGRIAFPHVDGLVVREPTISWELSAEAARAHKLEITYLARGLGWRADYVLLLDEGETSGDLTGWVTVTNRSGATFTDARLQLVAGDVRRVTDDPQQVGAIRMEAMRMADASFAEESLLEYHLYTLDRPVTLVRNEQKQLQLLEASGVGIRRRLVVQGQTHYFRGQLGEPPRETVGVTLEFTNSPQQRLGSPLPRGIVRVYRTDRSGARQFVGEDRIQHVPRNETARIRVGDAFDVVAERRQMEHRVVSRCVAESSWEITLRNQKDSAVEVDIIEPAGGDWTILSSSHRAERLDARSFRFRVPIPAGGETKVEYQVRVRWC